MKQPKENRKAYSSTGNGDGVSRLFLVGFPVFQFWFKNSITGQYRPPQVANPMSLKSDGLDGGIQLVAICNLITRCR